MAYDGRPSDPRGEFIGRVHVVIEGDRAAPAVALVHGIPGSVRDFRYLGPALADAGMCAVRIDMPGFGETPIDAFASTRGPDRAGFVRGVMRALGHEHFAIAGHSFGGGVGLLAASIYRDDVMALACMNSIGPRRHRGAGSPVKLALLVGVLVNAPAIGDPFHELVKCWYAGKGLRSENGLDKVTVGHHMRVISGVHYQDFRLACTRIECPVLVASADDDPLVEPACALALVHKLDHSALVTHLRAKHGGHFVQKHEAASIARWFATTLARTRSPSSSR